MALGIGEVTASRLNVRNNPYVKKNGRSSTVLASLNRGDLVNVDAATGRWLEVRRRPQGRPAGFVHSDYIRMLPDAAAESHVFLAETPLAADNDMRPEHAIDPGPHVRTARAPLVKLWNRCGGLISLLATAIRIPPAMAVSVLQVESNGSGFTSGPEPRMIIRFENHVFWNRWGKTSSTRSDRFGQHFRFDKRKRWKGHEFRSGRSWETFHGRQGREWNVFEFASALDREAHEQSACSISMGSAQIMGFNHARVGFSTAREMFEAFGRSEDAQVRGFFDFISGPNGASSMLSALRRGDLEAFATRYNGSGQAGHYAGLIEDELETFAELARIEPSLRSA